MTTVIIGLDHQLAEPIRNEVRSLSNRVHIYDIIPQAYTKDGMFLVKHPSMDSTWLNPSAVIYYSYFPRAKRIRKSLALSNTPSYPPVQQTILHDNKVLSLVLRKNMGCLMPNDLPRGYIPSLVGVDFEREVVLKQGNKHCGENKKLFKGPALRYPVQRFGRALRQGRVLSSSDNWKESLEYSLPVKRLEKECKWHPNSHSK